MGDRSHVWRLLVQVDRSFRRLYGWLGCRRNARSVVAGTIVIHTCLLAYSAYVHSPTLNEPAHLVAGLSHWKFGRFELYRVNPPLVRMVAAIPVIAVGYEEDWSGFYEGPGARPVFAMGEDFVAANGPRTYSLFMIARWACIPFSWLGAICCFLWARDLYGQQAGVLASTFWCFEPNILAHASLITADAHATALGLAACYTFWRWLKNPTWIQAVLTGIVLGLAELAKTTLILFYPLWPLLWLMYRWKDRSSMSIRRWGREAGMLAVRMLIGLYVVNLGYGFEGGLQPLGKLEFVSEMLAGELEVSHESSGNRFRNSALARLPVPLPENYILGIDIQQQDFEDYGRPSYLRGEWQDKGWWYYYLYAGLIKVPLGLLLLGIFSIASRWPYSRGKQKQFRRDEIVLLLPSLLIFLVVSSKTGFSEHFRYVLPTFPFTFIWIGGQTFGSLSRRVQNRVDIGKEVGQLKRHYSAMLILSASLFIWFSASSIWIYPHSLSYFNESIGGPLNGPCHLSGSSVDWGQDLRIAAAALRTLNGNATIVFDIVGVDPRSVGLLWNSMPLVGDEPETEYVSLGLAGGDNRYERRIFLGPAVRAQEKEADAILARILKQTNSLRTIRVAYGLALYICDAQEEPED